MSGDENPLPPATQPGVQTQIDGLASWMKEMMETITIRPSRWGMLSHKATLTALRTHKWYPRPTKGNTRTRNGSWLTDTGKDHTYPIQEPTTAFLDLAFKLKKPVENKPHKEWEERFQVPECDATRCPKLDSIIEDVVKKDAVDENSQLSRLQNFYLRPLVAAFEELRKDEPDADLVGIAVQQALLFYNANTHVSQVQHAKF